MVASAFAYCCGAVADVRFEQGLLVLCVENGGEDDIVRLVIGTKAECALQDVQAGGNVQRYRFAGQPGGCLRRQFAFRFVGGGLFGGEEAVV